MAARGGAQSYTIVGLRRRGLHVDVNGQPHRSKAIRTRTRILIRASLSANKRTAKYVGGGAVVGTVLGALLGGGKGAAIGALAGGAAGAGAQVYTGKSKGLPAETALTYKLAQLLTLRPVASQSGGALQQW